jgi:hypothetical protein
VISVERAIKQVVRILIKGWKKNRNHPKTHRCDLKENELLKKQSQPRKKA